MLAGSTSLLENKTQRAAAKNRSCKQSDSHGPPPAASKLMASSTRLTTGAPSTAGSPPPPTVSEPDGTHNYDMGPDDARSDDDAGPDTTYNDADNDIPSSAAPTGDRNRQSAKTCPATATPPLPVIPSQSSKQVVMEFLSSSTKPLTLMRTLVPAMAKSVCSGVSIAKIRVSRTWRPKTDKGKLWQQTVEVDHVLLRAADKTKGRTEGETMVSLRRMMATRSAPALESVAEMLLMVEKEPKAKATLIRFNLRLQRTQLRRSVSVAPMTGITIAGDEPAGQGQPSAPIVLGEPSAPAFQGQPSAPTLATVQVSHATRPSVAVGGSAVGRGVAPQLWTAHPRGHPQNIPIRASKGMTCPNLREIGSGRGRGFSLVVFPTPLLLV